MIDYAIEKLTALLIQQSMKDKKEKRIECISKVKGYEGIIKLLKDMKEGK